MPQFTVGTLNCVLDSLVHGRTYCGGDHVLLGLQQRQNPTRKKPDFLYIPPPTKLLTTTWRPRRQKIKIPPQVSSETNLKRVACPEI